MPKIIDNLDEAIISYAKSVLVDSGYDSLNIRGIAKECKIAVGTFYNYFSGKEEVVITLIRKDWMDIAKSIDSLCKENISLKEKLMIISEELDSFSRNYLTVFYRMSELKSTNRECAEAGKLEYINESLSKLLIIEKEKGNIHFNTDPKVYSTFIVSNLMYRNKNQYVEISDLLDMLLTSA